jgi:hypothetical protein
VILIAGPAREPGGNPDTNIRSHLNSA